MLLAAARLSQYQDIFAHESITGDVLLECDDELLKNELGIQSRLHRIKLMKLINGNHSAESLLKGISAKCSSHT